MPDVVVVGDANVDIVVPYPVFLNEQRTKVRYPVPEIHGGGTAANTAVALAKLGETVAFVGTVGDDQYGRVVAQNLRDHDIGTQGLIVDPEVNTVGVFAFVDEHGERYLWGWPRENQSFKVLDLRDVDLAAIRDAKWVHSSGMAMTFPGSARDSLLEIFKEARAQGVPTSFDLNCRCDDRDLDEEFKTVLFQVIDQVDYLLGSGPDEFAHLGEGDWRQNAAALSESGKTVIARDGKNGAHAFTSGNTISVPAYVVEVGDTIGAGDNFNAGFITSVLAGQDLSSALEVANAVSGYSVERNGPQSSPTAQDLAEFMDSHSVSNH